MRTDGFVVIAVCVNFVRYASRYWLFHQFLAHMRALNVQVLVVELAFGDRPFEVTELGNPMHLQLRTDQEFWAKEVLINIGIRHLQLIRPDVEYVAWVDADITFLRQDIASETIQQLQHYDVVQMFAEALDTGPNGESLLSHYGFMYQYHRNGTLLPDDAKGSWHPGYAWAARMSALKKLPLPFPLFDQAILGSGDRHMAMALIGKAALSVPRGISAGYRTQVETWGKLVEIHIRRNVGFVPGLIVHHWHGAKANRKYIERWQVLIETGFDPTRDLVRDAQGLYRLVDFMDERSIRLRDLLRAYFRQRDEDSTHVEPEAA